MKFLALKYYPLKHWFSPKTENKNLLLSPMLNRSSVLREGLKSTEKTGETTYYVYSGGERVRKVVVDTTGTEKKKYERIYLGGYELYRKYDSSENLDLEREIHKVMDDQRMIAILEVKTVSGGNVIANGSRVTIKRYQYTNHLDSACLELNGTAQVLSYEEYHPFGTTSYSLHTNDSEVSLKRYRYVHKERDDETGLYYYGARYYAPWLCRFVSVDPLNDDYPYYSSYQYAGNKPINSIDLDGLEESNVIEPNGTPILEDQSKSPHAQGFIDLQYYSSNNIYVVAGGGEEKGFDTLYSIAKRFSTSVESIVEANQLKNTNIKAGERLVIPAPTNQPELNQNFNLEPSQVEVGPERSLLNDWTGVDFGIDWKKVADHIRNTPFIPGTLPPVPNPFFGAEAVYVDIGANIVTTEFDVGSYFILTGPEKGEFIPFTERAYGLAAEVSAGSEIGRVDVIGLDPAEFDSGYLFGDRNKVTASFGEGFAIGAGFSWSEVAGKDVISISLQFSASAQSMLSFSINTGQIMR